MIWKDSRMNNLPRLPKIFYFSTMFVACTITLFAVKNVMVYSNLEDKVVVTIGVLLAICFSINNIYMIIKGDGFVRSIRQEGEHFFLINYFNKQVIFKHSDIASIDIPKAGIGVKLGIILEIPAFNLMLKNGRKYEISSTVENIDSLKECLSPKDRDRECSPNCVSSENLT